MSEKILSVIIPSYNSKPYLDKCLGSLVVPELMDKIDVIVVNDGSSLYCNTLRTIPPVHNP